MDILDYVDADDPSATFDLVGQIDLAILRLEDFPLMGHVPKNDRLACAGYRILVVESYLVF